MEIAEIAKYYAGLPVSRAFYHVLAEKRAKHVFLQGLHASSAPLLFSTLSESGSKQCFLFVLNDQEEAAYFYHDLVQIIGEERVLFFPSAYKRAAKYGQKDAANEILRTEVLSVLSVLSYNSKPLMVISSPEALAEKVISRVNLEDNSIKLEINQSVDREDLQQRLFDSGFERVDYVYEPGQYAVRGSILDVFSFSSEYPYRIDFFGDEVDSIRQFQVESQLSMDKKDSVVIVPRMENNYNKSVSLLDFLPDDSAIFAKDLIWVSDKVSSIYKEVNDSEGLATRMRNLDRSTLDSTPQIVEYEPFVKNLFKFDHIEFGSKPLGVPDTTLTFDTSIQPVFHKNFDLVSSTLTDYLFKGYRIFVLSDSFKQTDRLKDIFEERGEIIPFTPVNKTLHEGFADNILKCCFFTDHQIFDRFHKYNLKSDKARNGKVALTLKELSEFEIGDYVVHMDHGVGKFGGLVRIPNGNTTQEVIKLIYKNDDVVFVSIHSLHKVSKYKGKEGDAPRIDKLGSGAWENLKERTKGKIKDIARDLIKLYSKRLEEKGFAYSKDSYLQNELEASFIYEDTPDQIKATSDVKSDMESSRPMDRLICGDVGFGKTEVAIRAAFKAVADNKQVAVLVPTTILAFQHYRTFMDRLKEFPCNIDYLSRARSAAQTTEILKKLAEGKIDIIVGTHKLIGKNVKFKDLGLLIIDEEQKFGVSVKEKLKQLKVNVDTLTMTATPIPRTLQFSLMGARDMSIIQTPPPNRYPIQTEVHVFSADIIREAVNFEMSRNGQLFLVSNRISSLFDLQSLVEKEVPDARVCIGHGQMNPDELEKTLTGFINYDYDVLIATSIIENGIDIPNVNTIIINQAQNFGLSDLHQMRGRVGRGNRKAFCYLLAPPLNLLPQDSRRRLQAIESFSELGSGIQLALQDLDIRGAGNLLGAEQSGFIADLGYEAYQKILKEAVRELKTDEFSDLFAKQAQKDEEDNIISTSAEMYVDDCNVESDLEMLFPSDFVPSSSERMLLYRELDGLENEKSIMAFRSRLEDRFGKIPQEALELIRLVTLRLIGKELGVEKIFLKGGRMSLFFISNLQSPYYGSEAFGNILGYATNYPMTCKLREDGGKRSMIIQNVGNVETAISILSEIKRDRIL